ncbi:MAG: SusC/RagA family TonB-linked outer membrane protein [Dysgonamonadaceae bacterium]|jgi:TonB-linked SusC/RagA family outer membrane protein|nr:SusC/RagA family TonB-linked outer membrane protein [Dysgonamonadaceae bacterium]
MKRNLLYICLIGFLYCFQSALAQESGEMIRGKVLSDMGEELVSATVLEVDATGRVITDAITDLNGEFSMKIKNSRNKLRFSYLGYITQDVAIGQKRSFDIMLKENNTLTEVVVTGRKTVSSGGMEIAYNEVPFAMQRISTAQFEGMSISSIDDALQGQIAGLDIVGSGNVGVGSQMRLRGISSLSSNSNPLIVINGVQRPDIATTDFDFNAATEQQFADLLMLNPDDIEDVTVLKDAGATAAYGSRGASGVLLISTKKGVTGPTRVNYTYKYSGSKQPAGLKMLNGNDYTMLMKQARFNPNQSSSASDIPEFTYDPNFSEYRYYNNNTDWRDAVLQYGSTHDHYLAISGGGERAKFRITGGYLSKEGTVIGQKWDRLTSRMNLDYRVSSRILFSTDFSFTYSDNDQNWSDSRSDNGYINGKSILYLAYKKMPNMSIYEKDADGNDLSTYYNMRKDSKLASGEQGYLRNPVALARLAVNNDKSYDILPTLRLQYDLLDPSEQTLRYDVYVSFDMNNSKSHKFLPKEVAANLWSSADVNRAEDNDSESFGIQSENKIQWKPNLGRDHSVSLFASLYTSSGTTNRQHLLATGYPNGHISDPSAEGYVRELTSGVDQWRTMAFNGQLLYSYRSKYIMYATLRREGSTRFGKDNKWGFFPGVSLRWNIAEENFFKRAKDYVNILAIRPSWGITGKAPDREYLHFSSYAPWSSYGGVSTIRPENLRLSNLKWETTNEYNLGFNLEAFNSKYAVEGNFFYRKVTDLLSKEAPLPTTTGYDKLSYRNVGSMKTLGWDVNIRANRFVKAGDFSADAYLNLANDVNTLVSLDEGVLRNYNKDFTYDNRNADYLQRLQVGHAYGSIYGFRYKGVYQYSIDNPNLVASGYTLGTAPVVRNADGGIIYDSKGKPLPMYYNYGPTGINYQFQGGDAIYEDINHDGSIDELDIVYLGNCNPKLSGGFGMTFRWKSLSVNTHFTFRYGNKIINTTRREAENMLTDNNQSIATNWRWRREGDVTTMPRALHAYGYNSLPSDRYVEDGSFTRFKNITLNYQIPNELVRKYNIKQLNLYMTVNNLLCFSKYEGVDPEIGYGSMGLSKDESITPRSKDFTVGLTIGF